MRTFAQKPKVTQPTASLGSMAFTQAAVKSKTAPDTGRLHWNFGQIPVHAPASARPEAKLTLGTPGDVHEQQADRISEQVMRMPEQKQPSTSEGIVPQSAVIRRTGERSSQKAEPSTATPDSFQEKLASSESSGRPLGDPVRQEMESKMGADFRGVRIHAGHDDHAMAEQIQAKAFAHRQHVYFNRGEFDATSQQGRKLLAHELAHVSQHGWIDGRIYRQKKAGEKQVRYAEEIKVESEDDIVSVSVYNLQGRLMFEQKGDVKSLTFDERYPVGMYLIAVKTGKGMYRTGRVFNMADSSVTVKIVVPLKPVIPGENWAGSRYEKVQSNLSQASKSYRTILSDFTSQTAEFNLAMNNAEYVGPKGAHHTMGTTLPKGLYGPDQTLSDQSTAIKGGTVSSYFSPEFEKDPDPNKARASTGTAATSATMTMNDLGRALALSHEAIHAKLLVEKNVGVSKSKTAHHELMATDTYRQSLVASLKEFSAKNDFKINEVDLELISWLGLLINATNLGSFIAWAKAKGIKDSVITKGYELDLADAPKCNEYLMKVRDNKMFPIIYNSPIQQKAGRFMVK